MVRLREIPRTAAFAWSTGTSKPLLVTGTRAGAVTADFSDETVLELWDLALDEQSQGLEIQAFASLKTDSSFYDLAWGPASTEHPRGVIAGALDNGSLDLWDAEKLLSGASDSLISRTSKHTGAIKSLQFNPLRPQLLATAGAKGELFIYDINDVSNPIRLGAGAARLEDIECVAWNRVVPHILATGGAGQFVTVWDLKTKKSSMTLKTNQRGISAIAWDPKNSTKLLTATSDDNTPSILLWDLRNSEAAKASLQGHEQGVLSLSWCQQDSDLLLSSGKDSRTLVWNPQTGAQYGELAQATNWSFETRFHPSNPNLTATASFDGKVVVQTLQDTNSTITQEPVQNNLDGEDFFSKAQTRPQAASFSLPKAPAWLERPAGASFGFGGQIVTFGRKAAAGGQPKASEVRIAKFSADSGIISAVKTFEAAVKKNELQEICDARLAKSSLSQGEKADWTVMKTMISTKPREGVVEYLGVSLAETEKIAGKANGDIAPAAAVAKDSEPQVNGDAKDSKRMSALFDDGDDFMSGLSATKSAKTDNPFQLLSAANSNSLEDRVTRSLMLGNFAKAAEVCMEEERFADALIIANCGGKELVDKVQFAYLAKTKEQPTYLRLLSSVVGDNLWDLVYNANLTNWKETMATLCTFAKPTDFPDLCEALGDRIGQEASNVPESRQNAALCYLVGGKLEKVVEIWAAELKQNETAAAEQASQEQDSAESSFSIHARSLQNFIEKVTVFRQVSKYNDESRDATSGFKLSALYDKYVEYADIVAAQGLLSIAKEYLDLVPAAYPAAETAKKRLSMASRTAVTPASMRAPATNIRSAAAARAQASSTFQPMQPLATGAGYSAPSQTPQPNAFGAAPPVPGYGPSNTFTPASAATPYAPPAAAVATSSPYAPSAAQYGQPTSDYAPAGIPQPRYTPYGQPQPQPSAPPMAGPPRSGTPSSNPPLLRAKDVGDWNDVPLMVKPPTRKNTPRAAPITAPFPGAISPSAAPPPPGAYGGQVGASQPPPPPPPPKAGQAGPPRMTSPLSAQPVPSYGSPPPQQPPAVTPSPYAPPASQQGSALPPPPAVGTIPRTASPYNAPPSGAPVPNRYAPSPAPAAHSQPPPPSHAVQPPPMMRPPPSNPYAPAAGSQPPSNNQYGPPSTPYGQPPPPGAQPSRPPMSAPPTGPPAAATPPPPRAAPPNAAPPQASARHPTGDRSHMSPQAQRLAGILSNDYQRVAATAPPNFAPQVRDTEKRLNLLFDHLNNNELIKPDTVEQLVQLAEAIQGKAYDVAHRIQVDIHENKTEECGNWMVGIKRLIAMSRATP